MSRGSDRSASFSMENGDRRYISALSTGPGNSRGTVRWCVAEEKLQGTLLTTKLFSMYEIYSQDSHSEPEIIFQDTSRIT